MILFRYLTREVLASLCLITGLLFVILMSNEFVRYLDQVAGGKFAVNILGELVILETPRFLAILLPFGLFLAILLTYGRFYADYELIALHACGFSLGQLMRLTLPLIIGLSLFTAMLNFWLSPELLSYRNKLLAQTGTAIELQTIRPGSFRQSGSGRKIIYVESISADRKSVKNIFVAQTNLREKLPPIVPWTILSANSGYQTIDPRTKEAFFIAVDGKRYQGTPGGQEYYITRFSTYGTRMDSHVGAINNPQESLSSLALWRATPPNKSSYFSELQWRLSAPIATLLLAFLAILLSRVNPRQGKYVHLLPAIIIYILYINLLLIGRNWIEEGDVSYQLGLWWIHGALGMVILLVWSRTLVWGRCRNGITNLIEFIR